MNKLRTFDQLLKDKGYKSKADFARQAEFYPQWIYIMAGTKPRTDTIKRLAKALPASQDEVRIALAVDRLFKLLDEEPELKKLLKTT